MAMFSSRAPSQRQVSLQHRSSAPVMVVGGKWGSAHSNSGNSNNSNSNSSSSSSSSSIQ